jgi:hypothetical protein
MNLKLQDVNRLRLLKNTSGQALWESLFVFPIGILVFTLIIWTAASGWSLFWIEFQLQDAVICLSDNSSYECGLKHEKLMKQGAFYLKISNLILTKGKNQLYGKINFSFPFSGRQNFRLEKVIPWPLRKQ